MKKFLNTLNQLIHCYDNVFVSSNSYTLCHSSFLLSFFKKIRLVFLNQYNQYMTCFKTNKSIFEYFKKTSLFLKTKIKIY